MVGNIIAVVAMVSLRVLLARAAFIAMVQIIQVALVDHLAVDLVVAVAALVAAALREVGKNEDVFRTRVATN